MLTGMPTYVHNINCTFHNTRTVKVVMQQPLCCHLLASMQTISLLMSSIVIVMLSRCCGFIGWVLSGVSGSDWLQGVADEYKRGCKTLSQSLPGQVTKGHQNGTSERETNEVCVYL